jgi:hypothetical protein
MRSRLLVLVLLSFALFGAVRVVRAQSLADVAKKEEERRKTVKDPGKTFTNKDLPDRPAPSTSASDDAGKATPPAAAAQPANGPGADQDKTTDAGKSDNDKDGDKTKDQKYWGDRMTALQDALGRDQILLDALQTRINSLTTDFVNRDDPAQRAVIAQNRDKTEDELARLKLTVEADTKAISDLEDEARRAGVPPGWLR